MSQRAKTRAVRLQNEHIKPPSSSSRSCLGKRRPYGGAERKEDLEPPTTMSHEYHIIPRTLRWLRRIRHRCGYGVHSPLAFNFITDVIYNQSPYYAYATLRQPLVPSISRLDEYDTHSGLTDRDLRLIFRLTNYQEPTHIYIIGAHEDTPSPTLISYLRAARPSAAITTGACTSEAPTAARSAVDLHYADTPDALHPDFTLTTGAMLIVRGIHRTAQSRARWEQLKAHPSVTLTFDLGRFGIALNRPKINRQDYIVNYF